MGGWPAISGRRLRGLLLALAFALARVLRLGGLVALALGGRAARGGRALSGAVGVGLLLLVLALRRVEVRVPAAALQHERRLGDQALDLPRPALRAHLDGLVGNP